jgi:hypothetical protein
LEILPELWPVGIESTDSLCYPSPIAAQLTPNAGTQKMTDARKLMTEMIASQPTEMLLDIARKLNLTTDSAEMTALFAVERELESRMSEEEFTALMNEFDAELMAS